MNQQQAELLFDFFASQAELGIKFWSKNTQYITKNGTEFYLENDVVQRKRKKGKMGDRYEVISNTRLGEGSFGSVMEIEGTLAPKNQRLQFRKERKSGKRRAVKIQEHSLQKKPLENLEQEYDYTNLADHLSIKEPTIIPLSKFTFRSYMVMDKLSGEEFFNIVIEDRKGENVLTTQQRREITMALLIALKTQVTDKGIIHRDLKPENIFVNLNQPISVTILDYGLATDSKIPDGKISLTAAYFAPEILNKQIKLTEKADIFSMARVLALLWRVDLETYNLAPLVTLSESAKYTPEKRLNKLFSGLKDLNLDEKQKIRLNLINMLQNDPDLRYNIDEAIEAFSSAPTVVKKSTSPLYNNVSLFKVQNNLFKFEEIKDSWLNDEQQLEIQKAIWQLEKEISSNWPYPNKERKKEKIKGLNLLLTYSQDFKLDIHQAIIKVEKLCPEFRSGTISKRIANLMEKLGAETLLPRTIV